MMSMLKDLIDGIQIDSEKLKSAACLIDDSLFEVFEWEEGMETRINNSKLTISFNYNLSVVSLIKSSLINHLIFIVSNCNESNLETMKNILTETEITECTIVTSKLPESIVVQNLAVSNPYESIQNSLKPVSTTIKYLPCHIINLLKPTEEIQKESVELGILASSVSRSSRPLTLLKLKESVKHGGIRDYKSTNQISAADLPLPVKQDLKSLAQELSSALVFSLGLDPIGSVFSLGKTSSIVGHNILPMVENLLTVRNSSEISESIKIINLNKCSEINPVLPCEPATLLLIDRTEDLFTPSCFSGPSPLAHRILSTLKYAQYFCKNENEEQVKVKDTLNCDVCVAYPHLQKQENPKTQFENPNPRLECPEGIKKLKEPMSALSGLPCKIRPSLCYKKTKKSENITNNILRFHIMSKTEEESKNTLILELTNSINLEHSSLPPPKKRGIGAEVLAFVQSLSLAPGDPQNPTTRRYQTLQETLGYNPRTCLRWNGLLSLSYAVIEAMQRSSGKQFQQICSWQNSFDVRASKDVELERVATSGEDLDLCLAHLLEGLSENGDRVNCVDIVHVLLQLPRLISLFRSRDQSSTNLDAIQDSVVSYLLDTSKIEELHYLKMLEFLTPKTLENILLYRESNKNLAEFLNNQFSENSVKKRTESDWDDFDEKNENNKDNDLLDQKISNLESEIRDLQDNITASIIGAFLPISELLEYYKNSTEIYNKTALEKNPDSVQLLPGLNCLAARTLDLLNEFKTGKSSSNLGEMTKKPTKVLRNTSGSGKNELIVNSPNEVFGLVAKLAQGCLRFHKSPADSGEAKLRDVFEFVETPMQQMKRAGLGLLSKGLGSLGFGYSAVSTLPQLPHPGDRNILVIFILGGISYKEVGQVQKVLEQEESKCRVILLSTNILNPENVFNLLYSVK